MFQIACNSETMNHHDITSLWIVRILSPASAWLVALLPLPTVWYLLRKALRFSWVCLHSLHWISSSDDLMAGDFDSTFCSKQWYTPQKVQADHSSWSASTKLGETNHWAESLSVTFLPDMFVPKTLTRLAPWAFISAAYKSIWSPHPSKKHPCIRHGIA